jgi:hypothetical protein
MNIFLKDQRRVFDQHLTALIDQPVMAYSRHILRKKISRIHLRGDRKLRDINLDFFFDYFIFPPASCRSTLSGVWKKGK